MRTKSTFLLIAPLVLAVGGALTPSNAPAAGAGPGPEDALHQVMLGDNLHLIAGYYYGDARQWERIWQANKDQIANPNRIARGSLLRIPNVVAPAETYADFAARARRVNAPAAAPVKAEASPVPATPAQEKSPGPGAPAMPGGPSATPGTPR